MVLDILVIALAVGIYLGWMLVWSFHFIAYIYSKYKFHLKSTKPIDREKLPGVSIIKPLMGCDENLFANLETFFNIDYPNFELLFCIQDNTDPSIGVVKRLMDKYPHVDAKCFTGGKHVGINPKINNMIQGYEVAKYDFFLISDAGLKTNRDTLKNMVSLMTDKVGLVHQLPFVSDRKGFVANVEKVYFGTCQSRMYLTINCLGINCVTGMSCLMRKKVIDDIGGLKAFGHYIAEDYFLAKEFLNKNWEIRLSNEPVIQNSATFSLQLWQNRMIRWCKLRLKINIMSWLEPFQECYLIGILASWAVNFLFEWNSLVFFLIHVLCWFLSDYCLLKSIQNGKLPFTKFDYVISWLYRETITYYLFFQALIDPTVQWRHGKYRLRWGGLAEEINLGSDELKRSATTTLLFSQTSHNNGHSVKQQQQSLQQQQQKQLVHQQSQQSSTLTLIQQIPSTTSSILPGTQQSNSLILNI